MYNTSFSISTISGQQAILIKEKDIWIDTRQAKRLCNRSSCWPTRQPTNQPAHQPNQTTDESPLAVQQIA